MPEIPASGIGRCPLKVTSRSRSLGRSLMGAAELRKDWNGMQMSHWSDSLDVDLVRRTSCSHSEAVCSYEGELMRSVRRQPSRQDVAFHDDDWDANHRVQ